MQEVYRNERESYKLDLSLNDTYCIELFSFPDSPSRVSRPEATGLRRLAFSVDKLEQVVKTLENKGVICEQIYADEWTGKHDTFFSDPDGLPLELYEVEYI